MLSLRKKTFISIVDYYYIVTNTYTFLDRNFTDIKWKIKEKNPRKR